MSQVAYRVLEINEAFLSYQGEGLNIGRPTFFIRMSRCDLTCKWCDTMPDPEGEVRKDTVVDAKGKPDRLVLPIYYKGPIDEGLLDHLEGLGLPEPGSWYDLCFTGGEPTLYDLGALSKLLEQYGDKHTVESNGNHVLSHATCPSLWWTISPKLQFKLGRGLTHAKLFAELYNTNTAAMHDEFPGQIKLVLWQPTTEDPYDSIAASEEFLDELMELIPPRWVHSNLIIQPEWSAFIPKVGTEEELQAIYSKYMIDARAPRSPFVRQAIVEYIQERWNWGKYGGRFIPQTHKLIGVR